MLSPEGNEVKNGNKRTKAIFIGKLKIYAFKRNRVNVQW